MKGEGRRKVRSDKKRDVRATVTIELKDCIYRLNEVTKVKVKDISEQFTLLVMRDKDMMNDFSEYFKRTIKVGNTLYRGSINNKQMIKLLPGRTETISIKFKQSDYNYISDLAYVFNISASRMVAVLIQYAVADLEIIADFIVTHKDLRFTQSETIILKEILTYVNYATDSSYSWRYFLNLMSDILGEKISRLEALE